MPEERKSGLRLTGAAQGKDGAAGRREAPKKT